MNAVQCIAAWHLSTTLRMVSHLACLPSPCESLHNVQRYSTQLDYRQDYSFMDAPLRNTSNSQGATPGSSSPLDSKVVLRQPVPNRRLPAYLDGSLAWGSPPTEVGRRGRRGTGGGGSAGRLAEVSDLWCFPLVAPCGPSHVSIRLKVRLTVCLSVLLITYA